GDLTSSGADPPPVVPKGTPLCTVLLGQDTALTSRPLLERASAIFEVMQDVDGLFEDHNRIPFYTWSDQECCLPAGATMATLGRHLPHLAAGDLLIFEELLGPLTGDAADADPAHRCAVRLTRVQAFDADDHPLTDPLTGSEITIIEWGVEDALPFPL